MYVYICMYILEFECCSLVEEKEDRERECVVADYLVHSL